MGADVVQNDETGQDAGEQAEVSSEGGTWVALKDAAAHLGISIDTVKRRMKRGEFESRRETIPQGFRWLVRVDTAKTEAVESSVSVANENRGVAVPSPAIDVVIALQHDLEVRKREVASLLETNATQARALEQNAQTIADLREQLKAAESPERDDTDDQDQSPQHEETSVPVSAWVRLWRRIAGVT